MTVTSIPTKNAGPLDYLLRVFRSLRDSRANLMSATLCAAGVLLFARGLERWRVVAFVHDTGASRSPAPYNAQFTEWARPVSDAGLVGRWYVAISDPQDLPAACTAAMTRASTVFGRGLAVLVAGRVAAHTPPLCPAQAGASVRIPVLARTYRDLGPTSDSFLRGGVALLDERLMVRYGSRFATDLPRLPAIIGLFRSGAIDEAWSQ